MEYNLPDHVSSCDSLVSSRYCIQSKFECETKTMYHRDNFFTMTLHKSTRVKEDMLPFLFGKMC